MKWRKLLVLVVAPVVSYPVTILAANYFNQSFNLVLLSATFIYGVCLYYGTFQPSLSLQRDELIPVIRCVLTELDKNLNSSKSGNCQFRYNVMEVRRRLLSKYLSITVCTQGHSEAELEIEWRKGYGACGNAWKDRDQVIFDDQDAFRHKLTKTQEEITSKVKCVLSTPITSRSGRVLGILNVDSVTHNSDAAGLKTERFRNTAKTYAELLARIL